MRKKTLIVYLCSLLLILAGCKSAAEKTTESSLPIETSEKKVEKKQQEDASNVTEKFDYTYNPERPLWLLIEGTNEMLKADGNYQTMVAMEAVQNAEIRKTLQNKYNEGYALKLQLDQDEPTGIILLMKPDKENEELKVAKNLLDYEYGKKQADKASEDEKKQWEEKMGEPQDTNNTQGAIKNFDEAVAQAKKWLEMSDEKAQEYLFYDFGLGDDGRVFYQIVMRPKEEVSDAKETSLNVYADNGETTYGE